MNFLRLFFLTACLAAISVLAQDKGPIKIDLEGYINDRNNEMASPQVPVKEEPKKEEVKKEEPKKEEGGSRRRRTTATEESTSTTPVAPINKGPIKKIDLNKFKTEKADPMMMYIIIGGAVLLIVIIVVLIVVLKKKKAANARKSSYTDDSVTLADKIEAHEQAVAAETTENEAPVVPYAEGEEHHTPTNSEEMAEQFARETALNEKGQNASGIIIDEDKYFDGGGSFVDEDFSDLDGPHDGQESAEPSSQPDSPNLPPG
ncbi:MAG: hypothetical protein NE328_13930 [Lentisphaeraceae bacterium]|nr:hypothetical protein [Lentisphaeraceae bacterium]